MENNLPKGWVETTLSGIADWGSGGTPKSTEAKYYNGDIPWLMIGDLNDGEIKKSQKSITKLGLENSSAKMVKIDSILCAMYGSIGKLGIAKIPCATNQAIAFTEKIYGDIPHKYLFYYLFALKKYLLEIGKGGTQQNISQTVLKEVPIPLPPLAEQHRIVARLDALMQKVESNKQRLEKIPKLLKRFRQSVLAAAVNNGGEEEITKNICEEIQIGPFGTQLHRHEYISNGIPLVNPTQIKGGEIIPDMLLTVSKVKFNELSNYHLKIGDTIMGRRGEMARCALVGQKEDGWLCGTGSLFFRPNLKKVNPQYLYWVLSNSNTKAFLEGEAKGSTMSNLNLNIVRNIPLPLPSLKEQTKIVNQVEKLFAFADKIEARYTKAKAMLDKLPQSILAKAFRGELVAQNSNDEPASVLLERIKAEKGKLAEGKKGKKIKEYAMDDEPLKIAAEAGIKYNKIKPGK